MDQAFSLVRQCRVSAADFFKQNTDPSLLLGKDVVCCCECRAPVMLRGSEGGAVRPHFAHYPVPSDKIEEAVPCDSRVTGGSESYIRSEQKKHKIYGLGYLMRRFDLYQVLALNNAVPPGTPMFPRLETWKVDREPTQGELAHMATIPGKPQLVDMRLRFGLTTETDSLSKAVVAEQLRLRRQIDPRNRHIKMLTMGDTVINRDPGLDIYKGIKQYYLSDKRFRVNRMTEAATSSGEFEFIAASKIAELSSDMLLLAASKQNERLFSSVQLSVFTFCLAEAVGRFRADKQAKLQPWGKIENGDLVISREEFFDFLTDLCAKQISFISGWDDADRWLITKGEIFQRNICTLDGWIELAGPLWYAPLAMHALWFINTACWLKQEPDCAGGLMTSLDVMARVEIKGQNTQAILDTYALNTALVIAPLLLQEMPFQDVFRDMLADPERIDRLAETNTGREGFIYLAHDKALDLLWGKKTVKIGKSSDPERRGRQLAGQVLAKPLRIYRVWLVRDMDKAERLVFDGLRKKRAAANRELFHANVVDAGSRIDTILRGSGLLVEVAA